MALVLNLTDGTTTLNLNDTTNYGIPDGEYTPAISKRRRSGMGGWQYDDVEERIPLHVRGATGAAALDNLIALIDLLDQAERFWMGEDVDPVLIQYLPNNTNLGAVVQSEVLGPVGDTTPWLRLSPYINDASNYELPEIEVRILRRGDWLAAADEASSSATEPSQLMACTLSESIPLYAPLSVDLSGMNYTTDDGGGFYSVNIPDGVLLLSSASDKIQLWEAENYNSSISSPVTDVVDATASGGNYIRMSSGQSVRYDGINSFYITGSLIAIYAMCHLTVATDQWQIYTSIYRDGSVGADEQSNTITLDGQTGYKPVKLGILGRASESFTLNVTVTRLSGSGSIEFDVFCLLALGQPSERTIAVNSLIFFDGAAATYNAAMGIRHKRLESRKPSGYVEFSDGTYGAGLPYDGDIHLASIGDKVYGVWMAGGTSDWKHNDDAGIVSLTMTASRRRAYLAPR